MSKPRLAEKVETKTDAPAPEINVASPVVELKKAVPRLHPSRLHLDSNAHNTWAAHPERSATLEQMLEPSFWAHISEQKLRTGDTIIIYPADGSYRAGLAVRAAGRLFAQVSLLWKTEFPELAIDDVSAKFTTEFADPQTKWAVVRVSDKAIMQGGFDTQDAAMRWLGSNARSLAA